MTNPTPHGQVPEALRLADDLEASSHFPGNMRSCNNAAAAELRRQHARIAELEAEIAGGVQALSAAPAVPGGWKLVPVEPTNDMQKAADEWAAKGFDWPKAVYRAMLAASPTPPAEQQATKETSGGFHVWRDISTAPKDGSHFVATGHNYGLYSEGRHICVAQWFRGCWMETSAWNETSELIYLTHWMPLPSPPDDVAAPAEQQAAPKAAPGEPSDWKPLKTSKEGRDAVRSFFREKLKRHDFDEYIMKSLAADFACVLGGYLRAAPQQEAQEPALFVSAKQLADLVDPSHATGGSYLPARKTRAGLFTQPLYTAPQPAPAPLSDDTERLEWLLWKLPGDALRYVVGELADTSSGSEFRAAIDAARAAQGGK